MPAFKDLELLPVPDDVAAAVEKVLRNRHEL